MRSWLAAARRHDGFTVVEAIVAFAILSLVIATTTEIIGGAASRERKARAAMTALIHAQSQLALLSSNPSVFDNATSGAFDDAYTWRLTISPMRHLDGAGEDSLPHLAEIEVFTPSKDASVLVTTILVTAAEPFARP